MSATAGESPYRAVQQQPGFQFFDRANIEQIMSKVTTGTLLAIGLFFAYGMLSTIVYILQHWILFLLIWLGCFGFSIWFTHWIGVQLKNTYQKLRTGFIDLWDISSQSNYPVHFYGIAQPRARPIPLPTSSPSSLTLLQRERSLPVAASPEPSQLQLVNSTSSFTIFRKEYQSNYRNESSTSS